MEKIKNVIEAIDLTIERHQAVLDGKYEDYGVAKEETKPEDWVFDCPLCEFSVNGCNECPWVKFTGNPCSIPLYRDDAKSIKRLNDWKSKLMNLTKTSKPSNAEN